MKLFLFFFFLFHFQILIWFLNRRSIRRQGLMGQVLETSGFCSVIFLFSFFSVRALESFYQGTAPLPWPAAAWLFSLSAFGGGQWVKHLYWVIFRKRRVFTRVISRRVVRLGDPPFPFLRWLGLSNHLYEVEVLEVETALEHWPEALDGLSLVHLSDFHFGSWCHEGYLRRVRELAETCEADYWCLTGDFLNRPKDIPRALRWLEGAARSRPILAVLGNHDHWAGEEEVARALESFGVAVLRDEARFFEHGEGKLVFLGVRDFWHRNPESEKKLNDFSAQGKILLAHNPDHFFLAKRLGCHLQLSGHCHGGQIRLPWIGPLVVPSDHGRRYASGFIREKPSATVLFVHRGVGAYPPVRLFCRPQVVRLILRSCQEKATSL